MLNVYKNQQSWQTGSRNLMGPKMLPTVDDNGIIVVNVHNTSTSPIR
jgi:hypothetical protein